MDAERPPQRLSESMLALQEALGGRYLLKRVLGKGGMGIVYLAKEPALDRLVALKVLPLAMANGRRRERFLQEAKIAARLKHDHIVPIHAVDEAGPFVYYTMAYIQGETLWERIMTDGPLPAGEVTRILHDVARAVAYAHEHGVIHRDVKPQNILLEQETGRAYVADFGIARVMNEGLLPGGGGGGGRTLGTWTYTSPEQAAGLPADRRSDVYSLGVVGYVMATGELLFKGSAADVLKQHMTRPAPPLRVLNRHLDTTLSRAVGRCLAKDPAERFQTAGELARALSLAPELRSDLPLPLRRFLRGLKLVSHSAPLGLLLGLGALFTLGNAVLDGAWGTAAQAAAVLGLVSAAPIVAALPVTRRLLKAGYARSDILHALRMDLDRQREELAFPKDRPPDLLATWARRIAVCCFGLFALGAVAAVVAPSLPTTPVMASMSIGAFLGVFAGAVVMGRERQRNKLKGLRWLRFWDSRLGEWTAKLAGIGLGALPLEPGPAEPLLLAEPHGAGPNDLDALPDVVHRTGACVRRGRACLAASSATREREARTPTPEELEFEQTLERQVAVLEVLLDKFLREDAATADPGSLTADLEAAQALCEAVDGLIEGGEWRL